MDQTQPEPDSSQSPAADPASTLEEKQESTLATAASASSKDDEDDNVSDPPIPTTTTVVKPKTMASGMSTSSVGGSATSASDSNSTNINNDGENEDAMPQDNDANKQPRRTKKWTDTNSDKHCIQQKKNPLSRLVYSISLATGYYAIEPLDKKLSLVLGYVLLAIFMLLMYVFCQGFQEGMESISTIVEDVETMTHSAAEVATEAVVEATAAAEDSEL
mmetsp:Transcript_23510/g.50993  ORF Transcript_23510/g.50993 Transcript_23510/m.50993 type:complete len:218 (-) Transcript_23510:200-853(-)